MGKMKLILGALLVCFLLAIMDMRQIFEYKKLKGEVMLLEKQQSQLIARHKQLLTSIAVMSSFSRLDSLAQDRLGLHKIESAKIKKIILRNPCLKGKHED